MDADALWVVTATMLVCQLLGVLVVVFDDGSMLVVDDAATLVVDNNGTLDADNDDTLDAKDEASIAGKF